MARSKNPYPQRDYSTGKLLLARYGKEYFAAMGRLGGRVSADRRKAEKHAHIQVLASQQLRAKVRAIALVTGTALTFVCREALGDYVERWEQQYGPLPTEGETAKPRTNEEAAG